MAWSKDPSRRRGVPTTQRQRIMARHHGTCHVCGHPQAEQIDHIINVKRWLREQLPGSPHRDSNLAPIHDQPCPTCGARCHVAKTNSEAQEGRAKVSRQRPAEPHPGRI
jgi:5-methylcytosine-specific restriction endonuclease McrA